MKRVLSIDFDYFINTDLETRNEKFPDGVDAKDNEHMLKDWDSFYKQYPEIKDIGVIPEFDSVCLALKHMEKAKVFIAMSHKDIETIFDFNDDGQSYDVAHIDFHHDMYLGANPNTLDCSNWVRFLMDKCPYSEVHWVRREDSETSSLLGEYPYDSYTEWILLPKYDYVFLCFSPEWTPPHLKPFFDKMCREVQHLEPTYL